MKLIGLTGHIATGKTTVLKIFKTLGYPTISCDEIYHKMLKTNNKLKKQLISAFGKDILYQGKISTKKLAGALNCSINKLKILEKITHPIILNETFKKIKQIKYKNHKFCIVDIPLLFEKNLKEKFDYVIVVYCSKQRQIKRLKKRRINNSLLKILLNNQIPLRKKIKMADFVIYNDFDKKQKLKKEVIKIINFLNKLEN
ncbi:MAG: dephospho-CoA kinase [Endomicrobiia bacterium]